MSMFKVWLREPNQSDDEAIKLVVDEMADVSDVILKVPELLRVQHLKPSEIQAEYKDAVLSNRLLISTVFEGANEGTLVIRPRPGVNITPINGLKELTTSGTGNERNLKNIPSVNRLKEYSLPSPRQKTLIKSPRVNPETFKKTLSLTGENSKPPIHRSVSRGPSPLRDIKLNTPRGRKSSITRSQKESNTPSRLSTPRRDTSVSNLDRNTRSISRHIDPKNVSSRFRQEAEKVRVVPKRNQTNTPCGNFKPQWGKPLCANCNHSKQAHWASQREKEPVIDNETSSENAGIMSEIREIHDNTTNGKIIVDTENNNNNLNNDVVSFIEHQD